MITSTIEGFREETQGHEYVVKGSGSTYVITSKVKSKMIEIEELIKVNGHEDATLTPQLRNIYLPFLHGSAVTPHNYWYQLARSCNVFNNFGERYVTIGAVKSAFGVPLPAGHEGALSLLLPNEPMRLDTTADILKMHSIIADYAEEFEIVLEKMFMEYKTSKKE